MTGLVDKYVKLLENVYTAQVTDGGPGAAGPGPAGRNRDLARNGSAEGLLRCLAKAEFQFDAVQTSEALAREYFLGLSGINIGLAAHVWHRYATYAETGAEEARQLLLGEARRLFAGYGSQEPFRLKKTLNEARQRAQGGFAAARKDSAYLEQLGKVETLADLCFSVLVLDDDGLEKEIFGNVGFLVADNDACNTFVDRFSLMVNVLDETARGKAAVRFLSYIKRFEWRKDDPMVIRMAIRFNLYSTIIGKNHKEEADAFFRELIRRRSYRYFRHVERIFPGVSFDSLGFTAEEFVGKVIAEYPAEISSEELVDGLRVADRLIMRNGENLEKLEYWRSLVMSAAGGETTDAGESAGGDSAGAGTGSARSATGLGRGERDFFEVYCYLRGLEIDRENLEARILRLSPGAEEVPAGEEAAGSGQPGAGERAGRLADFAGRLPESIDLRALDGLEQRVTSAIIRDCPEMTLPFLKGLGAWNYYRFDERETVFKSCVPDDGAAALLSSLARCLAPEELSAAYMNSFLRSAVPVSVLLELIYKNSPNQRGDVLMVKRVFEPYRMVGKLISFRDRISVEAVSFNAGGKKLRVFRMNDTVRMELDKYYRRNWREKSGVYIHFKITAAMVGEFFEPEVWLDYSEFIPTEMKKLNNTVLDRFVAALRTVAANAYADDGSLAALKDTPLIPVKEGIASDIGLEVIRALDSLPDNRERAELLREIRCNHYILWRSEKVNYGDLGEQPSLRGFLRDVVTDRGSFEDKFYLYCNTALRANIYFDFFLSRCFQEGRDVPLEEYFSGTGIWFRGRIAPPAKEGGVTEAPAKEGTPAGDAAGAPASGDGPAEAKAGAPAKGYTVIPQSVFMAPYLHRRNEYFLETEEELRLGTQVRFVIDYLDAAAHRFVIRRYELIERDNTLFFEGMAKARATTVLEGRDLYALTQRMSPRALQKNRWKLAVYELEALRLRKDDPEELSRFMEQIRDANPWTFGEEGLPCVFNRFRGDNTDFVEPMVSDFIRDYGAEKAIRLYFDTSLRSVMPLESFIRALSAAGALDAAAWAVFSDYPFRFTRWENFYVGNVWLKRNPAECLGGDPEEGRYVACGCDERRKAVLYRKIREKKTDSAD